MTLAITFLAPGRLWLLLAVAALVVAYVVLQQRRRHYAARFTNLDLLASVAPKHSGWRRHLSGAIVGLGLVALIVGIARPVRNEKVPSEQAIVMMAVDVSASMNATDVAPTRLEAARAAAERFVKGVPKKFQVGLVAFDQSAQVLATPTTDHASVIAAIEGMQVGPGTATGDAISTAVDTVKSTLNRARADGSAKKGKLPAATIVLVSDGVPTLGEPVSQATAQAKAANVPVTTIAYGTANGQVTVQGETVDVPADPATMEQIADDTGGSFFTAQSSNQLKKVYDDIQGRVGFHLEPREILRWFIALALVALFLGVLVSFVWTGRFL
jgi:Ca-activated chloride channel family protein